MKPSLKWSIIFGSGAAVVNFATSFLGALLISPVASSIASYFVLKGGRTSNAPRLGARVGMIVGLNGILGFLVSFVAGSVLWNLMSLALALTTIRDTSFFSNLLAWMEVSALNALILFVLGFLVSVLSIGLSVAAGAIVGAIMAARHSASTLSSDSQSS